MCGAIGRVIDNPFVKTLMQQLGIRLGTASEHEIRPNARIPIGIAKNGQPHGVNASWWLFQSKTAQGYTYDKRYKSFNTRRDKLFNHRKSDFLYRRCVIPASCFYEWKDNRYKIEAIDSAIAFGGLYKIWPTEDPDSPHYSCSIITLPAHPRFSHIHDKSLPLMLMPQEITPWLDDSFHHAEYWRPILEPQIRLDLKVTPVDRKNPEQAIGESEIIKKD